MKYIALIVATVATLTTAAAVAKSAAAAGGSVPVYYLIRHAEKNPDGTISADGKKREQCLIRVFGKESKYNIQHIMVQKYHPGDTEGDHTTQRPYNTTLPLARSLGITIDDPCDLTDISCAAKEALAYTGPGNVLIAWEHDHLPLVSRAIGGQNVPTYPGSDFGLIYEQPFPYSSVAIGDEDCSGLGQ